MPCAANAITSFQLTNSDFWGTIPMTTSTGDYFYRLRVGFPPRRLGDYYVYYRSQMQLSFTGVVKYAVRDKELLDVFAPNVDEVIEISSDEYFEHMWE